MGFWDGSGISWTVCKQPAHLSRQITTPTPRHSIFTGRMLSKQQCQSSEGMMAHISCTYRRYLGGGLDGSCVLQQQFNDFDSVLLTRDVQRCEPVLRTSKFSLPLNPPAVVPLL